MTTKIESSDIADLEPKPFELNIPIRVSDIDLIGHVNNISYLRWVQEAATAHWQAIAPPADQETLLWVVVRHEIDYLKAAYLEDGIIARTWIGGASRFRFERHTELLRASDRCLLARARTLWCPIHPGTGKPADVSPAIRSLFSTGTKLS
jgi:acyl-CoA thioester hydrolase